MNKNVPAWKGFLLAISAALLWGVSGTCCQFLFEQRGINAEWLVTVRLLIAGGLLLLYAGMQKGSAIFNIWKNRKDALQLLLFSILGMLAVQYTYFAAIDHSNAATATVLQYAGPVLIAIYLALRHRRLPTPAEYAAIALAIAGTFLLVTHGQFGTLAISGVALFWGIASAFALAFYTIHPVYLLRRYDAGQVIGWSMLVGGLVFSLVRSPWEVTGVWDGYTYGLTAFIILLGSLFAFYAYLTAVKQIGAQTTSLLASVEPLSAAALSVVWLQTSFGLMDWLGSLCIVSTIFLLAQNGKKAKAVAA